MASPVVYDALKAFLLGRYAHVIDYDTIDAALEQGTDPFLCLEELFGLEEPISFGDPSSVCTEEQANILVHCLVPAPESSAIARNLAQSVVEVLRGRDLGGGISITEVSPPELEEMNNGLWTASSIEVTMRRFFHVTPTP